VTHPAVPPSYRPNAPPQRVLVIGGVGSSKTSFAERLATVTGLPCIPLDGYRYRPDGQRTDRAELGSIASDLAHERQWICEGIFLTWTGPLLNAADTIIWLDPPPLVAAYRVMRRWTFDRFLHRRLPYGLRKCARLARSAIQPHDLASLRASNKNLNPSSQAFFEATDPWRAKTVRLRRRQELDSLCAALAYGKR
jgi:hypothetical protein